MKILNNYNEMYQFKYKLGTRLELKFEGYENINVTIVARKYLKNEKENNFRLFYLSNGEKLFVSKTLTVLIDKYSYNYFCKEINIL